MNDSPSALEMALLYARLGWRVAPVKPGTKHPRIDEWQTEATTNVVQIAAWWGWMPDSGVSYVIDHPHFVLDVDPRHGGDETLRDLEAQYGALPDTVRAITGGGGTHHVMRNTRDVQIVNNAGTALGVGLDIRGVGGQIVVAPTLHPDTGVAYAWEIGYGPDEHAVADAPEWLLDMLTAVPVREPRRERSARPDGEELPGDAFNASTTWPDLLIPDGWTLHSVHRSGYELWRGPHHHEHQGPSASLYYRNTDLLHVFTGSIPNLVEDETYDKFGYVVRTRYGGDFAAAARELGADRRAERDDAIWKMLTANSGTSATTAPAADNDDDDDDELETNTRIGGDTTLSEVLVELSGGNHRFILPWGQWYAWNGEVWVPDEHETMIQEVAKHVNRHLIGELARATSEDHHKTLVKLGDRARTAAGVKAMIQLARSHPNIVLHYDELDRHHMLITVGNGCLYLATGTLSPYNRAHFLTKRTDVTYDAAATCPRWEQFLEEVLPDADVRDYMQRFVGYSLTGLTLEHVMLFLIGSGANGKSVLLSVLRRLHGDYGRPMRSDVLMVQPNQQHPQEVAALHGARLVTSSEIEAGSRLHEPRVKELTGGDAISTRRLYQNEWTFTPTHKFVLAANHLPTIRGGDEGIWRRLRVVRFDVTIDESRRDPHLTERLYGELPGIMQWALEGLAKWREEGLGLPLAVDMATADYRSTQDVLARFFADRGYRLEPGATARGDELHASFQRWCASQVPPLNPPQTRAWGAMLAEKGLRQARRSIGGTQIRVWEGLAEPSLTPPLPSATSVQTDLF